MNTRKAIGLFHFNVSASTSTPTKMSVPAIRKRGAILFSCISITYFPFQYFTLSSFAVL